MQHPDRPPFRIPILAAFFFAHACAVADAAVEGAAGADGSATHAIWLVQNLPFKFRSDRTAYTCPVFKEKVRGVLLEVGVHPSLVIHLKCDSTQPAPQALTRGRNRARWTGEVESTPATPTYLSGTSSHITARISLAAPAVANEQNIRHATTFDAEQQLLASMKSEALPTPSTITVFAAAWTPVLVKSRGDFRLEADDCDLLRQLSQQVFPAIGVKVMRKVNCSVAKISKPSVDIQALMPIASATTPKP